MDRKILAVVAVIGLVIGLVLGILIGVFLLPNLIGNTGLIESDYERITVFAGNTNGMILASIVTFSIINMAHIQAQKIPLQLV